MPDFKISKRLFLALSLGLLTANVIVWQEVAFFRDQNLKVIFFDVGQGDSILIETPEKHLILIDGGPDDSILEKLNDMMPFWRRRINLIVLTHPHADHLYGLINVLDRYRVDNILWNGVDCSEELCARWFSLLDKENQNVIIAQAGQRIKSKSVFLDVIYPIKSVYRYLPRDHNSASVVTKLTYGYNSFLLTGDILAPGENEMMGYWQEYLESNVLKVAHHGSRLSSQDDFLDFVQPELAVIQVGQDNRYGHPDQELLERLTLRSIDLRRTDKNQDVRIISNGLNYYYE